MADLKTQPNKRRVAAFLNTLSNEQQRRAAQTLVDILDDINLPTLRKLIRQSVQNTIKTNPT